MSHPSPTSATECLLFSWLKQFGVTQESTGLILYEGSGPEERGLRTNGYWNRTSKKEDLLKTHHGASASTASTAFTDASSSSCTADAVFSSSSSPAIPPLSHSPLISLPRSLLITPDKIRISSLIQSLLLPEDIERAGDSELLCLFLIHQHRLSKQSKWYAYIQSLPRSYTSTEWWRDDELVRCHSEEIVKGAARRRKEVREEWRKVCAWIWKKKQDTTATNVASSFAATNSEASTNEEDTSLLLLKWNSPGLIPFSADFSPLDESLPTLAEYQWAWSTVSTRSCFLPQQEGEETKVDSINNPASSSLKLTPRQNTTILIPFLDMLNHSSHVTVQVRLTSKFYQLWQTSPSQLQLSPNSEVFISYGLHSNRVLLEQYGFCMLHNQHECLKVDWTRVESFLTERQELMEEEEWKELGRPINTEETVSSSSTSTGATASGTLPPSFFLCSCSPPLPPLSLSSGLTLPRYSRPLPGFDPNITKWQVELLKACGLYDVAEVCESANVAASSVVTSTSAPSSSPSAKKITFTLQPCIIPFNLLTYIRIRVLTLEDVREYLKTAATALNASSTTRSKSSSSSSHRSLVSRTASYPSSSSALSSSDLMLISSVLLNEDTPYLSRAHHLLTKRVCIEFIVSVMRGICTSTSSSQQQTSVNQNVHQLQNGTTASSTGGVAATSPTSTSFREDVELWYRHHHELATVPFSYVHQQALVLRLTQKRLCCTLLAHLLREKDSNRVEEQHALCVR